jgi:hypothetical protein
MMNVQEEYHAHEGCQYRFAIRRVQQRFGVAPDAVCPVCEDRTEKLFALKPNDKADTARRR